ncbi:MAG: TolB-like translocation protein [Anaerolineae bacterium]
MRTRRGRRIPRATLVIAVALLVTTLAGCQAVQEAIYPGELGESPTAQKTSAVALEPSAIPVEGATLQPAPGGEPTAVSAWSRPVVYLLGDTLYRSGATDTPPIELAQLPAARAAHAYAYGLLAVVHDEGIDLFDLRRGEEESITLAQPNAFLNEQLHWSVSGRFLLHSGLVVDADAPTFARSVELRTVDPATGEQSAPLRISDVTGVDVLRYDDEAGQVTLVPRGGDPTFSQVRVYDVAAGTLVRTEDVPGEGTAALSPDGRFLLVPQQVNGALRLALYDLQEPAEPRAWPLDPHTHAVGFRWSHDIGRVAFVLREGRFPWDDSPNGLGVWVLDATTMQATLVADEPSPLAEIVGWEPDDRALLVRAPDSDRAALYEAVDVEDGTRRSLALPPGTQVLGWFDDAGVLSPLAQGDVWATRFQEAASDGEATAAVVARFAASQAGLSDEALTKRAAEYLQAAGWEPGLAGPRLQAVSAGLFVAQLPPHAIYVLDGGQAFLVAEGDLIRDVRQQGGDLGLIYATIGASAEQPTFQLLRREGGGWQSAWTPQGLRDWIATDGEIAFAGPGLDRLRVAGSSFGLVVEGDAFAECHACLHRLLVGYWVREGDSYVRSTELPPDAPLADVYWEMAERGPYAVLHEVLRRARVGLSLDDLLAESAVASQLSDLGFLAEGVRLEPEQESADTVFFGSDDGRYAALVQAGKLVRVERLDE